MSLEVNSVSSLIKIAFPINSFRLDNTPIIDIFNDALGGSFNC